MSDLVRIIQAELEGKQAEPLPSGGEFSSQREEVLAALAQQHGFHADDLDLLDGIADEDLPAAAARLANRLADAPRRPRPDTAQSRGRNIGRIEPEDPLTEAMKKAASGALAW